MCDQLDDTGGNPRFAGVVFEGAGDLDAAAEIVEEACRRQGMESRSRPAEGRVEITSVQRRSPWAVVWRGLPQRIDWRLERTAEDGGLRVAADFRLSPWYLRLLAGAALAIAAVLAGAFLAGGQPRVRSDPALSAVLAGVVVLALVATGWFVRALGPLGGGRSAAVLWNTLRSRLAAGGGHLGPVHHTMTRRYVRAMRGLAVALALLLLWWGAAGLAMAADALDALSMLALPVLAALVLLGGLRVVTGPAGSEARVEALLPGMATAASFVLFLGVPLLPLLLAPGAPPPSPLAARLTLAALGAGVVLAVGLGALAVAGAGRFAPTLERLSGRRRGTDRRAVSSSRVLRAVRGGFVALWVCLGLLVLAEIGLLTSAVLAALGWASPPPGARLVAAWEVLWAAALPAGAGSRPALLALLPAVSAGWLAGGLSLGQLAVARWRTARRLRRGERTAGDPETGRLGRWLAGLGRSGVRLAVRQGERGIDAQAHRVGVLRPRCYVEVSRGALHHLDPPRLHALVAHETAHHLAGHAALFNRLRWLGRLTLVGDGFVQTLQHSFGYETEADRTAVRQLGVEPETLAAALTLLRAVNAAERRRAGTVPDGLAADGAGPGSRERPGTVERFLRQYTDPVSHHYWHPDPEERAALLTGAGQHEDQMGGQSDGEG